MYNTSIVKVKEHWFHYVIKYKYLAYQIRNLNDIIFIKEELYAW